MVTCDISTIFGVCFGLEIADNEVKEAFGMKWGFTIDLFIVRFSFTGWEEDDAT